MKRLLWALASAGMFALFVPATASAGTLTLVTIDCGDGYPLTATVDLATLTELQASVQAIIDNPSGLTCSLSTSPLLSPVTGLTAFETTASSGFLLDRAAEWTGLADSSNSVDATAGAQFFFIDTASGSGSQTYVIGGGRYAGGACEANFGISAHLDNGVFHGSQAFTDCNGHQQANVTCLDVAFPTAEIRGEITAASGLYAGNVQDPPNTFITDVTDNSGSGFADRIGQSSGPPNIEFFCAAQPGSTPIDNGHITVRPLS